MAYKHTFKIEVKGDEKDAVRSAKKLSDGYQGAFRKIGGFLQAHKVALLAGAAAIAGSVAALGKLAKATADTGDKYAKMSQQVGLSVETLSAFDHVAQINGVTIETVAMGLKNLSTRALDVTQGLAESKRSFEALGISVTDNNGELKDAEALFIEVADKIGSLENKTQKVAIATEIFGRAGMKLIPMFNSGAEGIRSLLQESDDLGITWRSDTAKSAEDMNDALTRMGGALKGVRNVIGIALLPVIESMADKMTDFVVNNRNEFQGWLQQAILPAISGVAMLTDGLYLMVTGLNLGARGLNALNVLVNPFQGFVDDTDEFRAKLDASTQAIIDYRVELEGLFFEGNKSGDTNNSGGNSGSRPAPVPTPDPAEVVGKAQEITGIYKDEWYAASLSVKATSLGTLAEQLMEERQAKLGIHIQTLEEMAAADASARMSRAQAEAEAMAERKAAMMAHFTELQESMSFSLETGLGNIFGTIGKGSDAAKKAGMQMLKSLQRGFTDMIANMIVEQIKFENIKKLLVVKSFLIEKGKMLASAFAQTYQSIAAIPIVGPFLAPAAAAAAVVAVGAGIKNLAGLAEGGIVTQPGVFRLAEAGKSEAVIPLDDSVPIEITVNHSGPLDVENTREIGEILHQHVADAIGK